MTDVLILSGGRGTRAAERYPGVPKLLIPHGGQRAIDWVIKPFDRYGFSIKLNVREDEAEHFYRIPFSRIMEAKPVGNAGALRNIVRMWTNIGLSDPFIAVHNDTYCDIDPNELVKFHNRSGSRAVITVVSKNIAEEKECGMFLKSGYYATGFTRERWVNCGVYCISHSVTRYIGDGFQDIDKDLFPTLIARRALGCFEHSGEWETWAN